MRKIFILLFYSLFVFYTYAQDCSAEFTYTVSVGNPLQYTFMPSIESQNYLYTWYIYDSLEIVSTELYPIHIFSHRGKFLVTLVIQDTLNNCQSSYSEYIYAGCDGVLEADFSYLPDETDSLTIHFYNTSQYNQQSSISFFWFFGDGNTSNEENPTHIYLHHGSYIVTLYINNEFCSDTSIKIINTVYPEEDTCTARFSYSVVDEDSLTFRFKNSSSVGSFVDSSSYHWRFGDGTTYNGIDAAHRYLNSGIYKVSLSIENQSCVDSFFTYVYAGNYAWYPDTTQAFLWYEMDSKKSLTYHFVDLSYSNGKIINWLWDFGDGRYSTDADPVHTFLHSGLYDVKLKIHTDRYDSTEYRILFPAYPDSIYSQVCHALFFPQINNLTVRYKNISIGEYDSQHWDFGMIESQDHDPTIEYDEGGIHEVAFAIFNGNNNCTSIYKMWLDLTNSKILYARAVPLSYNSKVSENDNDIKIYPNPTNDKLIIDINQEMYSVEVYAQNGQQINISYIMKNDKLIIDTQKLANGIYFIKAESNNQTLFIKFIKE